MKKILVIDDETALLEAFEGFLRNEFTDITFLSADNGNTGLEIAGTEKPDLIILDMKLGAGPSGVEVLHRLKSLAPASRVIVWAGYCDPKIEEETRRLGAFAFVEKPADPSLLLSIIREAIGLDR